MSRLQLGHRDMVRATHAEHAHGGEKHEHAMCAAVERFAQSLSGESRSQGGIPQGGGIPLSLQKKLLSRCSSRVAEPGGKHYVNAATYFFAYGHPRQLSAAPQCKRLRPVFERVPGLYPRAILYPRVRLGVGGLQLPHDARHAMCNKRARGSSSGHCYARR